MSLGGPEDLSSIASHVQDCLNSFHDACNNLSKAKPNIRSKLLPGTIQESLGRFRLWVGNIGAHRRGRSSLDYKLREASHIRDRVLELLQSLKSVLQEALEIITEQRVPWEDLSDSDSENSDHESEQYDGEPTTELAQLASNMVEINICLMRLSMSIRNPAPHDQFKESTQIDVTHFEVFDVEHVRGKFPMAKDFLIFRLGKAISRRRQYLRYREEHRKKLERGLKPPEVTLPQQPSTTNTAPSEKFESTVASSIPLAIKASSSAPNLDDDDFYEDTLSQTSYASSNNDPSRLRPPPLPEQGQDGEPFECPLCFRITSIRQATAWSKHVYRDLQPYVCTFDECEVPDRTYESRHEWFQHELQAHRKWWECVEGCNQTFNSQHEFHQHLTVAHEEITDDERITDLMRSCERQVPMDVPADCTLCHSRLPSLIQLRRHLGKHHEELSLFALPSHMKDDDDAIEGETADKDSLSSVAGSGRSMPSAHVTCDECGLVFNEGNDTDRMALDDHMWNVHRRLGSQGHGPHGFAVAEELLRSNPAIVQAMDEQIFDTTLLNSRLRSYVPDDVNTWIQLKKWFADQPEWITRGVDPGQLKLLQAVQFNITITTQDFDEYFEQLARYHASEHGENIEKLEFLIDNRSVTLYQILKCVRKPLTLESLDKTSTWTNLGHDLGYGTYLTPEGAETLRQIYDRYILPVERHDVERRSNVQSLSPRLKDTKGPGPPRFQEHARFKILPEPVISFGEDVFLDIGKDGLAIENDGFVFYSSNTLSPGIKDCALGEHGVITIYGLHIAQSGGLHDVSFTAAVAEQTSDIWTHVKRYVDSRRIEKDSRIREGYQISDQASRSQEGAGTSSGDTAGPGIRDEVYEADIFQFTIEQLGTRPSDSREQVAIWNKKAAQIRNDYKAKHPPPRSSLVTQSSEPAFVERDARFASDLAGDVTSNPSLDTALDRATRSPPAARLRELEREAISTIVGIFSEATTLPPRTAGLDSRLSAQKDRLITWGINKGTKPEGGTAQDVSERLVKAGVAESAIGVLDAIVGLAAEAKQLRLSGDQNGYEGKIKALTSCIDVLHDILRAVPGESSVPVSDPSSQPDTNALYRKFQIQKDRLITWGVDWSDNSKGKGDINESLDQAGLTETVNSVLSTIRDISDEAEQLRTRAPGAKSLLEEKRAAASKSPSWTPADQSRCEDLIKDLTTSIDILYDLSRTRRSQRETSRNPSPHLKASTETPRPTTTQASPLNPVKPDSPPPVTSERRSNTDGGTLDPSDSASPDHHTDLPSASRQLPQQYYLDKYPPPIDSTQLQEQKDWFVLVTDLDNILGRSTHLYVYSTHVVLAVLGIPLSWFVYHKNISHLNVAEVITIQAVAGCQSDDNSQPVDVAEKRFTILPIDGAQVEEIGRFLSKYKRRCDPTYAPREGYDEPLLAPLQASKNVESIAVPALGNLTAETPVDDFADPSTPGGYLDSLYDELTSDPERPRDSIVARLFTDMMRSKRWTSLPEPSQQIMQSYAVEKKWSIMRGIWKAEGVDTSAFLPMQQRSAPVRQNTSMNPAQSFNETTDLSSTYETPGGDKSQQADDETKETVNQLEETEDLGRQHLDLSLALDSSEMVSEALLPIYNHLLTLRKCLMDVKASGGVSSPRELYPYSMKLNSIDNLRRNGKFMVGDDIPRGQSSLLQLLETCFDLLHDLRKDPGEDTSADAVRFEGIATSPREQTTDAAPTETASKHPAGPDGNPRSEPDVDVRVDATSVPSTPTYSKAVHFNEDLEQSPILDTRFEYIPESNTPADPETIFNPYVAGSSHSFSRLDVNASRIFADTGAWVDQHGEIAEPIPDVKSAMKSDSGEEDGDNVPEEDPTKEVWEDDVEFDELDFDSHQHTNAKPKLPSHRSLLTSTQNENTRAQTLQTPAPASSKPKKVEWPPAVRDYVGRAFDPANAIEGISNAEMQAKLKETISFFAERGAQESNDWPNHPLPQQILQNERRLKGSGAKRAETSGTIPRNAGVHSEAPIPSSRHQDPIPENRRRFAGSASNIGRLEIGDMNAGKVPASSRIRLSLTWDATPINVWLDLHGRGEAFFHAFQQLCAKRKGEFDRSRTLILLKPDKHAPEDEAYALSLDEDEMDADWETTVAWIEEHRRDKSPHLYGEVRVEEG